MLRAEHDSKMNAASSALGTSVASRNLARGARSASAYRVPRRFPRGASLGSTSRSSFSQVAGDMYFGTG